jgi:hypothetical protein
MDGFPFILPAESSMKLASDIKVRWQGKHPQWRRPSGLPVALFTPDKLPLVLEFHVSI